MYREVTQGIVIEATPEYVPEHSNPIHKLYYFSYRIRVTNENAFPVKLLSRQWVIRDGTGACRKVSGEGVIGIQPEIGPGQSFEYESFCPLPTPTGNMRGSYRLAKPDGETLECSIPLFFLRDTRSFAKSKAWVI